MNAGSNAGRGFRYQDAVIAFLVLECWQEGSGSVVPEGSDDAEIRFGDEVKYVQVKSRRQRLGLYKESEIRKHIREMWKRADSSESPPSSLLLVLESGTQNDTVREDLQEFCIRDCRSVSNRLQNDPEADRWMDRTSIRIVANPANAGNLITGSRLPWESLYRSILFAAIQDRVGNASNENGDRETGAKISLSSNEVETDISRLTGVLQPNSLPEAIRSGVCSSVDFITPIAEPEFYSGVIVRPGHLAAGLVVARPEECAETVATIERTKHAVITAPSGSGKSALMWEAAGSCKHTVRWFEVHSLAGFDIGSIRRLFDLLEPTLHAPIGFVIDDLGQNGIEIWKQLSQLVVSRDGVFLLGSLREEDLALIDAASRPSVLRFSINSELPQRIWQELSNQKKSTNKGWREAWDASNGLLLEYVHLLTQGSRLADTLSDQVGRRLNEKRNDELGLIRILSMVTETGATADVQKLLQTTGRSADELRRSLQRLEKEHVVRAVDEGRALTALHQLRSKYLAISSHHELTHPYEATLEIAAKIVSAKGLEAFIAYHVDEHTQTITSSFLERFKQTRSLAEFAAFLDGIDRAAMRQNAQEWVVSLVEAGIPKTQAGLIAQFALADQELPEILPDKFVPLYEDLQARFQQDERHAYLVQATDDLLAAIRMCTDVKEIAHFISSIHECQISQAIQDALTEWEFDLLNAPIDNVISVLEPCAETCRPVAVEWAKKAGVQELANRLLEHIPKATQPRFFDEKELQVVESNFVFDPTSDTDLDKANKQILDYLQSLAPTADRVDTRIVTADGKPFQIGPHELHRKIVNRQWLVGSSRPRRIRRWNAEIGFVLSPIGMTDYLSRGRKIFDEALPIISQLIDAIINDRKRKPSTLKALEALQERSANLVRPPQSDDGAIGVSKLQGVSYFITANLLPRLVKLPDQSMALHSYLHSQIDAIGEFLNEEPWELLPQGPPRRTEDTKKLFGKLMIVIEFCDIEKIGFGEAIHRLKPQKGKSSLQNLVEAASPKIDAERNKTLTQIEDTGRATGIECEVIVDTSGGKFGRRDFPVLILAEVDLELGPISTAAIVAEAVRDKFPFRSFTIIPHHEQRLMLSMGITGVDTWFPITDGLSEWESIIELKYFSSPLFTAFETLTQAALSISDSALGEGRKPDMIRLADPLSKFIALLPAAGTESFTLNYFKELFGVICSSNEFARSQYDAFKETEPSEIIQIFAGVRNEVAITAIRQTQNS